MAVAFYPKVFLFSVGTPGQKGRYVFTNRKSVIPGKWHHLACTFDKDKAAIFIDGNAYRRVSDPGGNYGMEHLGGAPLLIGKGGAKGFFNGLVAEVRLSSVVRYPRQFKPVYAPFESDANTVALWRFGGQ